jgi:hypothetical protein
MSWTIPVYDYLDEYGGGGGAQPPSPPRSRTPDIPNCIADPKPEDQLTKHWCSSKPVLCPKHARDAAVLRLALVLANAKSDLVPEYATASSSSTML